MRTRTDLHAAALADARTPLRASTAIAVGSGKGGVGTSTVAALLAAAVATEGHRTLLVDASNRLGAMHHLFGLDHTGSLRDLRGGHREPHELIVPVGTHLSLLSTAPDGVDLSATERRLLMRRVAGLYSHYTFVIIDAGSSAESILGACRDGATRLLAVTGSDRIAMIATYAVIKLLHEQLPQMRVDVVANRMESDMADQVHEQVNAASLRFLQRMVPFAGTIPDDPDFGKVLAAGLGAEQATLSSSATQAVREISDQLLFADAEAQPASAPFLRLLRKG